MISRCVGLGCQRCEAVVADGPTREKRACRCGSWMEDTPTLVLYAQKERMLGIEKGRRSHLSRERLAHIHQ